MTLRTARLDPTLQVSVLAATPLRYRAGPDASLDRPGWVRAASGLVWWQGALAVVQDDTHIVARIDPATGLAEAVHLPAADGVRQYGSDRGNKAAKLDHESCFVLPDGSLVALGSGSTAARRRVMRLDGPDATPRVFEARALYAALSAHTGFAGSELNLEGACLRGDTLWLFQRGNGAPRDGLQPQSATATLPLAGFLEYLQRAEADPDAPLGLPLAHVTAWDLGRLAGVPLSFTDAAVVPSPGGALAADTVAWIAAAEASPNTYDDGVNTGVVLGYFDTRGDAHCVRIEGADGAVETRKGEGLAFDPARPDHAWMVIDLDDPSRPAELLSLRLGRR